MLPALTVVADLLGIIGGYFVGVNVLDANPTVYIRRTTEYLKVDDIVNRLIKAAVFGGIIAIVSCDREFYTEGRGGVGKATMSAVVLSMMLILISNYFLNTVLF